MDPIIKLEHVDFWYDKGKPMEYHALKDVSLEIQKGEYVAFFGSSGSGKSTLLYLIAGIEQGQEGKILINGRNIPTLSKQELAVYRQIGVGIIFQQFNLIASLSVVQNVMFPMMFLGLSQDRAKTEAMGLLKRVNLEQYADRFPTELSGGQQQRVSIARALANNPPIVVADEPLGNLDSTNAQAVLDLLKELNEKDNRTIIMVTHEAWSLRGVKKIFYIKDGVVTGGKEEPAASPEAITERLYTKLAPESSENQLAARALAELLLRGYPREEVARFESFLLQRLDGKLTKEDFGALITKPWNDGGVGLWVRRAERIGMVIEEDREMKKIYQELEEHPEAPLYDDIEKLEQWLLEGYRGALSERQSTQLREAVVGRIKGALPAQVFAETLNRPRSKAGLGFSIHTAHRIEEKLDLILGVEKVKKNNLAAA
jgi:ABC-type lipoprotein export system ATPase subunit